MSDDGLAERWWTVTRGPGPVLATAIHDGHELRPAVAAAMNLSEPTACARRIRSPGRRWRASLRTSSLIVRASNSISTGRLIPRSIARRSRAGACGSGEASPTRRSSRPRWRSMRLITACSARCWTAWSRRTGASSSSTCTAIITGATVRTAIPCRRTKRPTSISAPFRCRAPTGRSSLDPLIEEMRRFDFNGRNLDVRENVAFQGKGEQTRFVHERYPGKGCAIALEFKKFFMDEWTGEPDPSRAERDARLHHLFGAGRDGPATALMARSAARTRSASRPSRCKEAQGWRRRGRLHLDRSLPFLVLHRRRMDDEPSASIARRVALNSPAYLIWDEGRDDAAALELLASS